MRLRKVSIRNVRSIEELEWEPPQDARWNVILGNNASGKSTFLRAVSLGLIGPREAFAARQNWNSWLRRGTDKAEIFLETGWTEDSLYSVNGFGIELKRENGRVEIQPALPQGTPYAHPLWDPPPRWFSAAYGPIRRFTGGDRDAERIFQINPLLGAHLSLYYDSVALSQVLEWLRDLNYKRLEGNREGDLLARVTDFVNQDGLLPYGIRMVNVSSEGVHFADTSGAPVLVEELSDGFRSVLSMTFELIRQISLLKNDDIFDAESKTIIVPEVVLIDEVDDHLHPTWQKEIGFWFTRHFPNMQFIVTTHSPLVCHAAIDGSIFLLPQPGSDETGRMLTGTARDRLIYGDILDAYSTGAFGDGDTRSSNASELMQRLAELNVKELRAGLSDTERREQSELRSTFPVLEKPFGLA